MATSIEPATISEEKHSRKWSKFSEDLQEIIKELPEQWKQILGSQGVALVSSFSKAYGSINVHEKLDEVWESVASGNSPGSQQVIHLVKKAKCDGLCPKEVKMMTSNELLQKIKEEKRTVAESTIKLSVIISTATIAIEMYGVYIVWTKIQEAKYVVESSKKVFPQIRENFSKLKDMVDTRLSSLITRYQESKDLEDLNRLCNLKNEIRRMLNDTTNLIHTIELKMEGGEKRLNEIISDQQRAMFSSAIHGIGSIVQGFNLAPNLSDGYALLQKVIVGGYFVVFGACAVNIICSKEEISNIRHTMETVDELKQETEKIEKSFEKLSLL